MNLICCVKNPRIIYKEKKRDVTMKFSIDPYEKELIVETIEYRIENDESFIRDNRIKEDLEYLLRELKMNTYNIEYNGITVLERIPEYALKKHLEMAKGFLYLQGSITLKDIEQGLSVSLNM